MFSRCIYPPACLGAPNKALENLYFDVNQKDLALVDLSVQSKTELKNATAIRNGSTAIPTGPCNTDLGFKQESRLCHTCNLTSKRQGVAQCALCPEGNQNIGLMIFGLVMAFSVLIFIVTTTINDAGKHSLSASIQKILLNYLQVAALARSFPLRWDRLDRVHRSKDLYIEFWIFYYRIFFANGTLNNDKRQCHNKKKMKDDF